MTPTRRIQLITYPLTASAMGIILWIMFLAGNAIDPKLPFLLKIAFGLIPVGLAGLTLTIFVMITIMIQSYIRMILSRSRWGRRQ